MTLSVPPALIQPGLWLCLLLVQTLIAWAVTSGLGLTGARSRRASRLLMHLLASMALTGLVAALLAWPLDALLRDKSMNAALILSGALLLPLLALWRTWPLFALPFIGDDKTSQAAALLAQSRALTRDFDTFFSQGLPAALALLLINGGALLLAFRPNALPVANQGLALLIHVAVLLPLAQMIVLTRGRQLLDVDAQDRRRRGRFDDLHGDDSTRRLPSGLHKAELDASLLAALRGGDGALAQEALQQGADPNALPEGDIRDRRGALVLAVTLPDLTTLRSLIAAGADVNAFSAGLSPLLAATRDSYEGRSEAVLTLLANGADARQGDDEGNTPLHHAARCADPAVAAELIDAGAELDAVNQEGHTPLGVACASANAVMANFLLERGAEAWLDGAEPPLCIAAAIAEDDPAVVKLLLKRKARIEATDRAGRNALNAACAAGHGRIVDALLAGGADADSLCADGRTPLMAAADAGAVDIIHALIKRRADVNRVDADGRTALALTCISRLGSEDCVRALLAANADRAQADNGGLRAVDHAAAEGRWHVVALLDPAYTLPSSVSTAVDATGLANVEHLADALRFEHWRVAAAYEGMISDWSSKTRTELLRGLDEPRQTAARDWLFNRSVDVNATLANGRDLPDTVIDELPATLPLMRHLLERGAVVNGRGLIARVLLAARAADNKADVYDLALDLIERGVDCHGRHRNHHPLHLAVSSNNADLLTRLLDRGVDPNARDAVGRTPLHLAVALPDDAGLALIPALIRAGAIPEIVAANGESALGQSLAHGQREIAAWLAWTRWPLPGRPLRDSDLAAAAATPDAAAVDRLIQIGLDIETEDDRGATALIRASGAGDVRAVGVLLDAGAESAHCASSGATPLSAAIGARREAVVSLLLDRGVDAGQKLPGGLTALHIAAALGLPRIAALLLAAGAAADATNATGTTPLHAAAQFGFSTSDTATVSALFDHLLRNGARASQQDEQQSDALMLLLGARAQPGAVRDAQSISLLTVQLLDHGAALDQQDARGVSALHACAMHDLLSCARHLKARGAPLDLADGLGRSAGEIAAKLGFAELATELGANRHAVPGVRQMLRQRTTD